MCTACAWLMVCAKQAIVAECMNRQMTICFWCAYGILKHSTVVQNNTSVGTQVLFLYQRMLCLQGSYGGDSEIVGLEWYSGQAGFCEPGCPVLAICLRTGQLQLMTDELDDTCLVINTGMQVSNIKWNSNGSVLAVSGVIAHNGNPAAAVVQFYSCYGEYVFAVRCCKWGLARHVLAKVCSHAGKQA